MSRSLSPEQGGRYLGEGRLECLFAEAGLRVVAAPRSTMDYDAREWIAHGGPDAATTAALRFTHRTGLVIGERPD